VLSRAFMKSGIDYNDDGEVVDVRGFALHTGAFFVPWKLLLTGHYPVAILDSSKPEPFTWTVAVNTAVDKLKVTLQMGAWWDRSNDNGGNSVIVKAVRLATAREGTWQGILRSLAERKLNERVAGHQATEVEDSKRDINADVTSRANCDAAEMGLMTEISILVVESGVKTESHEAEQKAGAESRGKMAGYKELLDSPAVAALAEGLGRALGNLGGGKNGGNGGNNP